MSALEKCADALLQQRAAQASAHERVGQQLQQLQQTTRTLTMQLNDALSEVKRKKENRDDLVKHCTRLPEKLNHSMALYSMSGKYVEKLTLEANAQKLTMEQSISFMKDYPQNLIESLLRIDSLIKAKRAVRFVCLSIQDGVIVSLSITLSKAVSALSDFTQTKHEEFLTYKKRMLEGKLLTIRNQMVSLISRIKKSRIQRVVRHATLLHLQREALFIECQVGSQQILTQSLVEGMETILIPSCHQLSESLLVSRQHTHELLVLMHSSLQNRVQQVTEMANRIDENEKAYNSEKERFQKMEKQKQNLSEIALKEGKREREAAEENVKNAQKESHKQFTQLQGVRMLNVLCAMYEGICIEKRQQLQNELIEMETARNLARGVAQGIRSMQRRQQHDLEAREALVAEEMLTRERLAEEQEVQERKDLEAEERVFRKRSIDSQLRREQKEQNEKEEKEQESNNNNNNRRRSTPRSDPHHHRNITTPGRNKMGGGNSGNKNNNIQEGSQSHDTAAATAGSLSTSISHPAGERQGGGQGGGGENTPARSNQNAPPPSNTTTKTPHTREKKRHHHHKRNSPTDSSSSTFASQFLGTRAGNTLKSPSSSRSCSSVGSDAGSFSCESDENEDGARGRTHERHRHIRHHHHGRRRLERDAAIPISSRMGNNNNSASSFSAGVAVATSAAATTNRGHTSKSHKSKRVHTETTPGNPTNPTFIPPFTDITNRSRHSTEETGGRGIIIPSTHPHSSLWEAAAAAVATSTIPTPTIGGSASPPETEWSLLRDLEISGGNSIGIGVGSIGKDTEAAMGGRAQKISLLSTQKPEKDFRKRPASRHQNDSQLQSERSLKNLANPTTNPLPLPPPSPRLSSRQQQRNVDLSGNPVVHGGSEHRRGLNDKLHIVGNQKNKNKGENEVLSFHSSSPCSSPSSSSLSFVSTQTRTKKGKEDNNDALKTKVVYTVNFGESEDDDEQPPKKVNLTAHQSRASKAFPDSKQKQTQEQEDMKPPGSKKVATTTIRRNNSSSSSSPLLDSDSNLNVKQILSQRSQRSEPPSEYQKKDNKLQQKAATTTTTTTAASSLSFSSIQGNTQKGGEGYLKRRRQSSTTHAMLSPSPLPRNPNGPNLSTTTTTTLNSNPIIVGGTRKSSAYLVGQQQKQQKQKQVPLTRAIGSTKAKGKGKSDGTPSSLIRTLLNTQDSVSEKKKHVGGGIEGIASSSRSGKMNSSREVKTASSGGGKRKRPSDSDDVFADIFSTY